MDYLIVERGKPAPVAEASQDKLFEEALSLYGGALERLARAYEADPEARRDLIQEIQIALWRSFTGFDQRCSLRTWVYRVAHNTAATNAGRKARTGRLPLVSVEDLDDVPGRGQEETEAARRHALDRLLDLIQSLKPLDRQVMLAYLEGLDAAETAEITGLSARNVATKIHRIKSVLARRFQEGGLA